jgi:hypothetical protein
MKVAGAFPYNPFGVSDLRIEPGTALVLNLFSGSLWGLGERRNEAF